MEGIDAKPQFFINSCRAVRDHFPDFILFSEDITDPRALSLLSWDVLGKPTVKEREPPAILYIIENYTIEADFAIDGNFSADTDITSEQLRNSLGFNTYFLDREDRVVYLDIGSPLWEIWESHYINTWAKKQY